LLRDDIDWWDLVQYGLQSFDVYARIGFAQDADGVDPAENRPSRSSSNAPSITQVR